MLHFYLCQILVLIKKITAYRTTYFTYGTVVNANSDVLLERRMHRWIQVPLKEAKRLKDEKKVAKNSGYEYMDQLTCQKMVEFHVDTCKTFMQQMNEETRFGGNLSVRMLPCQ